MAMSSSLIGLAHPMMPKQAPCLLAKSSTLLAMRHEMRYPFATWLSTQALNNRYRALHVPCNLLCSLSKGLVG